MSGVEITALYIYIVLGWLKRKAAVICSLFSSERKCINKFLKTHTINTFIFCTLSKTNYTHSRYIIEYVKFDLFNRILGCVLLARGVLTFDNLFTYYKRKRLKSKRTRIRSNYIIRFLIVLWFRRFVMQRFLFIVSVQTQLNKQRWQKEYDTIVSLGKQ